MSTFEDNLWADLLSRHGEHEHLDASRRAEQPADEVMARRERRGRTGQVDDHRGQTARLRPARYGLAAAAAAAALVGGLTLLQPGAPAYAVSTAADGSTTVRLEDLTAIQPANAALARAGSRVRVVPMTGDCPALDESALYRGEDWDLPVSHPDGSVTVGKVPEGYTMLLALGDYPGADLGSSFTAPVRDPAPSCLLSPTQDPSRRP